MTQEEIRRALRDFHWMENEIQRLYKEMQDLSPSAGVSQYGIEASMQRSKHTVLDKVGNHVVRNDRYGRMIRKLEKKVGLINKSMESITDDRMKTVLLCLLDGMSIVSIAKHLRISERHIYHLRDDIVTHIYNQIHGEGDDPSIKNLINTG
ncbi:helix-turn-helix domain-containing protein [Chengkuizengella sp. SCS-71B]|uniref:helix-turn-helix domain-containing protein n=1 Tax=Chengkuizengella sp. SCS-71B TaxID=3115290 RepID=UPI0032C20EBD